MSRPFLAPILLLTALTPAWGGERLTPRPLAEVLAELEKHAGGEDASLVRYGESAGGWPLIALRIAAKGGPIDQRPAVFLGANASGDRPLGSEAALHAIEALLADTPRAKALRARTCFYVVPVLNPDAHDDALEDSRWGRRGNDQRLDRDRDGFTGEDGPDDLDGDGRITQLRIEDEAGAWVEDPRQPDLLVRAAPELGEKGRYRLEVEGRDDDGDGAFNEDPREGVHLDRNFAHAFPYPAPEAGPWASSSPEAKSLMDFLLARRHVALALVYGEANVLLELPAAGAPPKGRAAERLLPEDRETLEGIARAYARHLRAAELPSERPADAIGPGSFAAWLYFHYGALTLELDLWRAPSDGPTPGKAGLSVAQLAKTSAADLLEKGPELEHLLEQLGAPARFGLEAIRARLGEGALTPAALATELEPYEAFAKTPAGKARKVARGRIAWWRGQGVAAITSFRPVRLGERTAAAGGLLRLEDQFPPQALGDATFRAHTALLLELAEQLGRIELRALTLQPLGSGVYRLEAVVGNGGRLPTHTGLATLAKVRRPLRLELQLGGARLVTGRAWAAHERLGGSADVFRRTWLVRAAGDAPPKLEARLTSEQAGTTSGRATLGKGR